MANPYNMPNLQTPVVDANGKISQVWAGLFREFAIGLKAEKAPGRIEFFELTATNLADATKFVQAGVTAGLGTGDYLGWALCNGNNGTMNRNGYFIYGSTAAAGTIVGSDTAAAGTTGAHTLTTGEIPTHNHTAPVYGFAPSPAHGHDTLTLFSAPSSSSGLAGTAPTNNAGTGGSHDHTTPAHDNRPLSMSAVPMMRV